MNNQFSLMKSFSFALKGTINNIHLYLVFTLGNLIIIFLPRLITWFFTAALHSSSALIQMIAIICLASSFAIIFVAIWIYAGYVKIALEIFDNGNSSLQAIASASPFIIRFFLLFFIISLVPQFIALMALGILVAFGYDYHQFWPIFTVISRMASLILSVFVLYSSNYIVDRNMSVIPALTKSFKLSYKFFAQSFVIACIANFHYFIMLIMSMTMAWGYTYTTTQQTIAQVLYALFIFPIMLLCAYAYRTLSSITES